MYIVNNQKELNHLVSYDAQDLRDIGIDSYEDNRILLNGSKFDIDCSSRLFMSFTKVVFIGGNDNTEILLINANLDSPFGSYDSEEIPIYFVQNVKFNNVYLTTDDFLELQFTDREGFQSWENVRFDTAKIRVLITNEEIRKFLDFLETYDVEGVLEPGDHVVVDRGLYTHHGIYIGNNKLIHFSGEPGTSGIITEVPLERFAKSDAFWVYKHDDAFEPNEIIRRAKSRLNEANYNVIFNNCEHFCHWCCTDQKWSTQVFSYFISKLANSGGALKYKLSR